MAQKTKTSAAKKAKPVARKSAGPTAAKSTKVKATAKLKTSTKTAKSEVKSQKTKPQAQKKTVKKTPPAKNVAKTKPTARTTATTRKAAKTSPTKSANTAAAAKKTAVPAKKRAVAAAKPAGQKVTAPVVEKAVSTPKAAPKAAAAKVAAPTNAPATPRDIAVKARDQVDAVPAGAPKRPVGQRHGFKTNEYIVYPAHGVGQIVSIEEQEIAGMTLELFVITFDKDKLTLRVPTGKSESVGMRKLAEGSVVNRALETLKGRARIKRTMWSRRAQEYEAKINSGDLISIAEVVRDLYRSESQPEQSYSERQLYEAALDRMAREIAAVDKLDDRGAVQKITEILSKSAKGRRAAAEAEDAIEDEAKAA